MLALFFPRATKCHNSKQMENNVSISGERSQKYPAYGYN